MSTEADPKTRLYHVFGVGYLDRDTERTRLQIFQGQYHRGYALCLFTSGHSGEILKYWPRFGGDFFRGSTRLAIGRIRYASRPVTQSPILYLLHR